MINSPFRSWLPRCQGPPEAGSTKTGLAWAWPRRDCGFMRGYGQYCPVALGAEVFAERWTPIIIRNLMIGCQRVGEVLDGAPGLPRSVLSQRLRRLEACGVVTRTPGRGGPVYQLTEAGRELGEVCLALGAWGARWREVLPAHI